MPSVAVTSCEGCGVSSEHPIAQGPIPLVGLCSCGGQRQIARIVFRSRNRARRSGPQHRPTTLPLEAEGQVPFAPTRPDRYEGARGGYN